MTWRARAETFQHHGQKVPQLHTPQGIQKGRGGARAIAQVLLLLHPPVHLASKMAFTSTPP